MEKKKILIAEDEPAMSEALSKKMINAGFDVIVAQDGEEGLKLAIEHEPDLAMLDILMPKIDGITLMKKIREQGNWGKEVPIIILTNLSDPESVTEAKKSNVHNFLVKTEWRLDDIVALAKKELNIIE